MPWPRATHPVLKVSSGSNQARRYRQGQRHSGMVLEPQESWSFMAMLHCWPSKCQVGKQTQVSQPHSPAWTCTLSHAALATGITGDDRPGTPYQWENADLNLTCVAAQSEGLRHKRAAAYKVTLAPFDGNLTRQPSSGDSS